jgi:hypothetical protein
MNDLEYKFGTFWSNVMKTDKLFSTKSWLNWQIFRKAFEASLAIDLRGL